MKMIQIGKIEKFIKLPFKKPEWLIPIKNDAYLNFVIDENKPAKPAKKRVHSYKFKKQCDYKSPTYLYEYQGDKFI